MIKRTLIIFCTLVLLLSIFCPILPLHGENEVYDKTVRLHVIANSDTEYDQELKLKVRDKVLQLLSDKLNYADSKEDAVQIIQNNSDKIVESVKKLVKEKGFDYDINLTLTNELYPTKAYNDVTMPAGEYLSLRILIGNADGQNWWCVLYPPLCTSGAEAKSTLKEAGFTSSQIKILTEGESAKYKIKFRILEFFEGITNKLFD